MGQIEIEIEIEILPFVDLPARLEARAVGSPDADAGNAPAELGL